MKVLVTAFVRISLAASLFLAGAASAQFCASSNPNEWPEPSRPYVILIADTSSAMTSPVGSVDGCGYGNDRRAHQRCAIDRITKAFAGQVDFALMHYPTVQSGCGAGCFGTCAYSDYPGNTAGAGCGPFSNTLPLIGRRGGVIAVPFRGMATPPPADNIGALGQAVDNVCTGDTELFASGFRPLAGALNDVHRYLSDTWTRPDGAVSYVSPLTSVANGERACRLIRVILFAAGGDTCDTDTAAVNAANNLRFNGIQRLGLTWFVRTHVIDVGPGTAALDNLAAPGGATAIDAQTDSAQYAAVSNILGAMLQGETADNTDNNCNGCVDEGYPVYGNVGQTCCAWATAAQRQTCLSNFLGSVNDTRPQGERSMLPCTSIEQAANPAQWLVFNPGETCDNIDNNLDGIVDEGLRKCGDPAQCPSEEVCDGRDNDCDGQTDEFVCAGCVVSAEVCDGCDNDCDSVADDGVAALACGQSLPANCAGTQTCGPQQVVAEPGACVAGGGFLACANSPSPETCDGLDNDCNGIADDDVPATPCEPPGTPGGLVYLGSSQCRQGQLSCGDTTCRGFVGPTPEVSDGIDNDCDGQVEEGIDLMFRNGFE